MPTIADRQRGLAPPLVLVLALAAAGCAPDRPKPAANLNDGRQHITRDRAASTVSCDLRPLQVDADRTSLRITGPCGEVIVAGDHNDVEADIRAGGTVEITGSHNDVTWHQVGRGPRPALLDRGQSNTFHAGAY